MFFLATILWSSPNRRSHEYVVQGFVRFNHSQDSTETNCYTFIKFINSQAHLNCFSLLRPSSGLKYDFRVEVAWCFRIAVIVLHTLTNTWQFVICASLSRKLLSFLMRRYICNLRSFQIISLIVDNIDSIKIIV